MLHGKEFGRSLSEATIHSLLPIFLAQVLHCHQLEPAHHHDGDEDGDDHDDPEYSNIDLTFFTRTSEPMQQSEFHPHHILLLELFLIWDDPGLDINIVSQKARKDLR